LRGILRALLVDIKEKRFAQGGSTLTQQLAKTTLLSPEKTIPRKIKELVLAIKLESKYTKDQILGFYLNQVPYGSNAYGIEAASNIYFGKSSRDLNISESATLAAMLKAPSYYSPWSAHKEDLLARKDYVIDRMKEEGFISENDANTAKKYNIEFLPPSIGSIRAPHFSLMVKEYLVNKYGEDLIMNGGLKITTTLDWKLQEIAENVVMEGAKNNEAAYGSKNAALVSQDPKTGQVLALVGSKDYFDIANEGNFNVAAQGMRQPGSALKPFVYMTGFQKGYTPNTIVFDVTTEFDTRNEIENSYRPQNFDGLTHGPIALRNALAQSLNIPAVKMLYLAGLNDSLKNIHNFGITTLKETWRYGLSLVLGGGEVKLVDIVNAYGSLSQEGIHHNQVIVLKVEDSSGNILEEYHDEADRVIDAEYPRMITKILSDPELRRPIFGNSLSYTVFDGYDVALKTGTSEDHRDAWTIGYTPFLVAGVWAGNNDNTAMIRQGGSILAAVPIWSAFMREAIKNYNPEQFQEPEPDEYIPKPMLNGEYIWKPTINGTIYPQAHSILFYVDRSDPTGPIPENPENDSQFKNWESAVEEWATKNVFGFTDFNKQIPSSLIYETERKNPSYGGVDDITISDFMPKNGSFDKSPLSIKANIESKSKLKKVELLINGVSVNGFELYQKKYNYWFFYSGALNPQNTLELHVTNESGFEHTEKSLIYVKN
jgi:membrane peptidoglycan carboxypeptidase